MHLKYSKGVTVTAIRVGAIWYTIGSNRQVGVLRVWNGHPKRNRGEAWKRRKIENKSDDRRTEVQKETWQILNWEENPKTRTY